jgi:hypothetical protein
MPYIQHFAFMVHQCAIGDPYPLVYFYFGRPRLYIFIFIQEPADGCYLSFLLPFFPISAGYIRLTIYVLELNFSFARLRHLNHINIFYGIDYELIILSTAILPEVKFRLGANISEDWEWK